MPGTPAKTLLVITNGPGSPDTPLGSQEAAKAQGPKIGQRCTCGTSFYVWMTHFDSGDPFECPTCGTSITGVERLLGGST